MYMRHTSVWLTRVIYSVSFSDSAVFGAPLEVAIQRSTLGTDQLELPTVFRQCIDFLEENGERSNICSVDLFPLCRHFYKISVVITHFYPFVTYRHKFLFICQCFLCSFSSSLFLPPSCRPCVSLSLSPKVSTIKVSTGCLGLSLRWKSSNLNLIKVGLCSAVLMWSST